MIGWNLESPTPGPEAGSTASDTLRIRGWLLAEGGSGHITVSQGGTVLVHQTANVRRVDVARTRANGPATGTTFENCGFDVTVPRCPGPYNLDVYTGPAKNAGRATMTFAIIDKQGGPYALIGRDQQLFLGGDSIGQFTENRDLPEASVAAWAENFRDMKDWEASISCAWRSLLRPPKRKCCPKRSPAAGPSQRARRFSYPLCRHRCRHSDP